jgi:hypothetical protein
MDYLFETNFETNLENSDASSISNLTSNDYARIIEHLGGSNAVGRQLPSVEEFNRDILLEGGGDSSGGEFMSKFEFNLTNEQKSLIKKVIAGLGIAAAGAFGVWKAKNLIGKNNGNNGNNGNNAEINSDGNAYENHLDKLEQKLKQKLVAGQVQQFPIIEANYTLYDVTDVDNLKINHKQFTNPVYVYQLRYHTNDSKSTDDFAKLCTIIGKSISLPSNYKIIRYYPYVILYNNDVLKPYAELLSDNLQLLPQDFVGYTTLDEKKYDNVIYEFRKIVQPSDDKNYIPFRPRSFPTYTFVPIAKTKDDTLKKISEMLERKKVEFINVTHPLHFHNIEKYTPNKQTIEKSDGLVEHPVVISKLGFSVYTYVVVSPFFYDNSSWYTQQYNVSITHDTSEKTPVSNQVRMVWGIRSGKSAEGSDAEGSNGGVRGGNFGGNFGGKFGGNPLVVQYIANVIGNIVILITLIVLIYYLFVTFYSTFGFTFNSTFGSASGDSSAPDLEVIIYDTGETSMLYDMTQNMEIV